MNQHPEQMARDMIDAALEAAGWVVQDMRRVNLSAGPGVVSGVAVKEYRTDVGPADYVLFVDGRPVGVIEAKREEEALHLTDVEGQSRGYAMAKLKHLDNAPLPFVYESTGGKTWFKDYRDPKPRAREVFRFHRPEALGRWIREEKTLRARMQALPELPTDGLLDCQIEAITNLEKSFKLNKPKALIQMATESGKTFTAITFIYRLLKFARAKRVLILVDIK